MSQEFPSVEELLPHKKPMVLIDRIESFSQEEKRLKSSFVGVIAEAATLSPLPKATVKISVPATRSIASEPAK